MSVVEKPKQSSPLGRAIERSRGNKALPPVPSRTVQQTVPTTTPLTENEKAKKVFEIQRKNVQRTLDNYKNETSVSGVVAGFIKRLEVADQAATDEAWQRARDLIQQLKTDLTELPQLVSDERDAETDCRKQLKDLTSHIKEYQNLDSKLQDTALLKFIDGEFKRIQKLVDAKSFATALELIREANKKILTAKQQAQSGKSPLVGEAAKKKLPKMLRTSVEREEKLAAHDLSVRVQSEMLGEALGVPEIRALMNEHRYCLNREVKSFKGYRWMDDVQLALDGARTQRDPKLIEGVTKDIRNMNESIQDAKSRQRRMYGLLKKIAPTSANQDALTEAQEFARGMLSHIPDEWLFEGERLEQRLPMMLKSEDERTKAKTEAMNISKEERAEEATLFKEIIEHGSLKGADRTQFFFDEPLRSIERDPMDERAIKKAQEAAALLQEYQQLDDDLQDEDFAKEMASTVSAADKQAKDAQTKLKKKATNADPDPAIAKALLESVTASENAISQLRKQLDDAGSPAQTKDSSSQYERLMKTFEKMIKRAYAIRDAGGTVAEVESSLEHVPPEFWPPQFIENLQAWRKVERELAEERVADIFENKDKFSFDDAKDCLSFVMETYGTIASTSYVHGASTGANDENGWMNAPAVAVLIEGYINELKGSFGCGEEAGEALISLDYSGLTCEKLSDLYDAIANSTSMFINAVINVKYVPGIPAESVFAAEVVPILGAVAAGIDLTVAVNALRKAITMRVKAGLMVNKAELEHFSGKMRDGGALVKAIKNERDARKRQIGKKSVDVTSKAVVLSGEITKAAVGSGWGTEQGVGYGLVLTGKAIEYGGKIVFAGIDWGIAHQAKKLIQEAQAGNPIARMELMENSGLYAKMYIAILAKEGHKLALKFIQQRGYDEEAVMRPSISLKILREAMLEHAEQRDETQVEDNLAIALTEGVTGGGPIKVVRLAGKGATALAKKVKDLPKDKKIPYNAAWKPTSPVSLSTADWQANKNDCIKNAGLYDESTGIDKALKPCEAEIKAADDALAEYEAGKSRAHDDRERLTKLVRSAQRPIGKAMDVIVAYYPGTNQGEMHQPMAQYLVSLRSMLGTHSNRLEQRLADLKILKVDWTPPHQPGTSADDWDKNWADAAKECNLPQQDGGVSEALHAYEKADGELAAVGTDQLKEKREKRVEIRDHLAAAGKALKALWSECSLFTGAVKYVDAMIGYVVKESQGNDNELNGFDWKDNPAKDFGSNPACFSAATWKKTYEAAAKEGFCNSKAKDGGMEKALNAWEQHPLAKNPKSIDAKELTKKRKEGTKLLAQVAKAAEKLAAANPDSHTEFLKYIAFLRRTAHAKIADFQREQDETNFNAIFGFDVDSWKRTYEAGVAASAIPKDDKAYKELEKALSSFGKEFDKMIKARQANKLKDAFNEAQKATAEVGGVHKALNHVAGTEGWTNNRLAQYFDGVRNQVQKELESGQIAEVLGGEKSDLKPQTFTFTNKGGWQDVKKAAVNSGLIADSKSGFGKLIDEYLKAEKKKSDAEKKKDKKPEVYKQSFNVAIARLKTIESTAAQMEKQTKNANFIAYFKEAGKQCRQKIAELEQSRPA